MKTQQELRKLPSVDRLLQEATVAALEARWGHELTVGAARETLDAARQGVRAGEPCPAIEALTRYMAVEFAERNISVNAVSPGVVATEALQHFDTMSDEDLLDKIAEQTPAGRIVTPEDVAEVVAYLCSPQAWMIRGQTILIDGGFTLPASGLQRP